MSCVLRTWGEDFEIDIFLRDSPLVPLTLYHKGDVRSRQRRLDSGMNVSVSTHEFSDLQGQIEDAIRFLTGNEQELLRLRHFPGVAGVCLDFPVEARDVAVQCDGFPPDLLALMGRLGISLFISRYPAADNESS